MITSIRFRRFALGTCLLFVVGAVACGKPDSSGPSSAPPGTPKTAPDAVTKTAPQQEAPKASPAAGTLNPPTPGMSGAKAAYEAMRVRSQEVHLADGSTMRCGSQDTDASRASRRLLTWSTKANDCNPTPVSIEELGRLISAPAKDPRTAEVLKSAEGCLPIREDLTAALAAPDLCGPSKDGTPLELDMTATLRLGNVLSLLTFAIAKRQGATKALEFALDAAAFAQRMSRGDMTLIRAMSFSRLAQGPVDIASKALASAPLPVEARQAALGRLNRLVARHNHIGHITRGEFAFTYESAQEVASADTTTMMPQLKGLSSTARKRVIDALVAGQFETTQVCPLEKPDTACTAALVKRAEAFAKDKEAATKAMMTLGKATRLEGLLAEAGEGKVVPLLVRMMAPQAALGPVFEKLGEGRAAMRALAGALAP